MWVLLSPASGERVGGKKLEAKQILVRSILRIFAKGKIIFVCHGQGPGNTRHLSTIQHWIHILHLGTQLQVSEGSDEQHGVDAAVVLRIVGHLSVLSPDDTPRCRHQAQLAHIHLNYCSLRDDA